ncbi:hypothetical protein LUX29_01105 [Aureimonas altamirensis]|uniref:hypothetical protein n=1 Tax=Aureimonas altamirensis TaxID=370622 RepID=UPI001E46C861|nr:hypothetical protein [Aureimonas altamirensis]UHD45886.1 hypothetical protein LUX29_01105 [Aureimonas altamirensis]
MSALTTTSTKAAVMPALPQPTPKNSAWWSTSALVILSLLLTTLGASAQAVEDRLQRGLEGALHGCEEWILKPSSWVEGLAPFLATVDLAGLIFETETLPAALLPPKEFRRGNRYFRIAAGEETGYALVVSSDIPMCHLTGGGALDLQPAAEEAITTDSFRARWDEISAETADGIVTTFFRSRVEPKLTLVYSRASTPNARRDRAQIIATALYDYSLPGDQRGGPTR